MISLLLTAHPAAINTIANNENPTPRGPIIFTPSFFNSNNTADATMGLNKTKSPGTCNAPVRIAAVTITVVPKKRLNALIMEWKGSPDISRSLQSLFQPLLCSFYHILSDMPMVVYTQSHEKAGPYKRPQK